MAGQAEQQASTGMSESHLVTRIVGLFMGLGFRRPPNPPFLRTLLGHEHQCAGRGRLAGA